MMGDDTMDYSNVFEWKIQNFTGCSIEEGKKLKTEVIIAGNLFRTRWVLSVYLRGTKENPKSLGCFLKRVEEKEKVGPKVLHINCEFSLVTFDGMQMFKESENFEFEEKNSYGFYSLATLEEIFRHKASLLQRDILTLRCKLRLLPPLKKQTSYHNFVTKFPLQTEKLSLTLEHLRNITKENPLINKIKGANNLLSLKVSLNQDKSRQIQVPESKPSCTKSSFLNIVMMKQKAVNPVYVSCSVKFLDKKSEYATENQISHIFSKINTEEEWTLPYFIDTDNLGDGCILEDETHYVDFEFTICDSPPETLQNADSTHLEVIKDPNESTLQKDLVDLLITNKYSDVTLRIGDETFAAHKSILAARSPRFDEIFTSSIEHTNSENEVLEINDVDKNTMALMLKFIYTDELGDINNEECFNLYYAAQKYRISSLRLKCLRILRSNLSTKSVYKVLLLSEELKDFSLKMIACKFILNCFEYFFLTPEWYAFYKEHEDISSEIVRYIRQKVL